MRTKLFLILFMSWSIILAQAESAQIHVDAIIINEILTYKISDSLDNPEKYELRIFISDTKNNTREIYRNEGYYFLVEDKNNEKTRKWMLFSVVSQKGDNEKPYIIDLYYLDGKAGLLTKIYSSVNFECLLSDDGSTLCIYDYVRSNDIPTIDIYKFPSMVIVKTVTVDTLKNKKTSPDSISFSKNQFVIELSNDGPNYEIVKVPIR